MNRFLQPNDITHLFSQMMDLKNKQKQLLQQGIYFCTIPMLRLEREECLVDAIEEKGFRPREVR